MACVIGKIVMFQLNTSSDDILVCLKSDYLRHIQKLLNIGGHSNINNMNTDAHQEEAQLLGRYVNIILSKCEYYTTTKELYEHEFCDSEIHSLLRFGVLLNHDAGRYRLAMPGVAPWVRYICFIFAGHVFVYIYIYIYI